jgi:hypothetical protein
VLSTPGTSPPHQSLPDRRLRCCCCRIRRRNKSRTVFTASRSRPISSSCNRGVVNHASNTSCTDWSLGRCGSLRFSTRDAMLTILQAGPLVRAAAPLRRRSTARPTKRSTPRARRQTTTRCLLIRRVDEVRPRGRFFSRPGSRKRFTAYGRDGRFFTHGDACDHVLYIQSGGVKLSVPSRTGREAVVATLRIEQDLIDQLRSAATSYSLDTKPLEYDRVMT